MHCALLVSDVLAEIFMHVNQIPGEKIVARKSLAALATTCKTFHEPAMDLLWAEVDHLQPLLGCVTRLHPLIYRRSRAPWDDTWAEGIKPLSADEACQFLRHSARIRSFNIQSNHLFPLLSVIPVDACVFPRLQSLTLSTGTYLGLFLSHTLRHCSVAPFNEYLEVLSIKICDKTTEDQLSLLSDRVRLCKQLVTLTCPPLDWAAWKHLSNLPTLAEVRVNEVCGHGAPPWPLEPHIVNFPSFLNLTTLSFMAGSAAYMNTIMQHSQFPSLKKFWINIKVLSSPEVERLFRGLSHYKQTLEELTIILSEYHDPQGNLTIIPHLLCFTQLRILQIHCFDFVIDLDNNFLLKAMSCWPHMRDLQIENSGRHSPILTVSGLFTMLRQCPHLYSLRVLIDTADIDTDPTAESIQHTSLQRLELDTFQSPIVGAKALARIIFNRLPCIDKVTSSDWRDWKEVNAHLTSLKAAALRVTGAASPT